MMLASWYVKLKHEFPTRLPPELEGNGDRLRFARWLVLTGRLSDFGPYPAELADGRRPSLEHFARARAA